MMTMKSLASMYRTALVQVHDNLVVTLRTINVTKFPPERNPPPMHISDGSSCNDATEQSSIV